MNRFAILFFTGVFGLLAAGDPPQVEIANQQLHLKIYPPDAQNGFYKATRFDWSGVISSLEYQGHNYYGPWFTGRDPSTRDFVFKDNDILVGNVSAMTGPVEEFSKAQGYDTAKAGDTFVKIGVGVLKKTDDTAYNWGKPYDLVDPGKWTVNKGADFISFTQELNDPKSGYGYVYTKTIRLTPNKPEMTIEHSLRNTGKMPIQTNLYDHNFLTLDKLGPGPDYTITTPFEIKNPRPPAAGTAEIHGNQATYLKPVEGQDRVSFGLSGFGTDPKDYDFRIENKKAGAGMRIQADRPLTNASLWSIRSVLAIEPFIDIAADPGKEFTWKYTYSYYTLPKNQ
jgi:hypothetical protein